MTALAKLLKEANALPGSNADSSLLRLSRRNLGALVELLEQVRTWLDSGDPIAVGSPIHERARALLTSIEKEASA